MYGCESWTVKKAECWRTGAFELWCWRRLLKVPWTARRSNQSILKEISPRISLEGMMLKLKLQDLGHLMRRADSLEKTLMLGGIGGRRQGEDRGWDGWMASLTRWTWVWVNSGSWWWTGRPGVLWFMGSQRVGCDWVTELNWSAWFYEHLQAVNSSVILNDTGLCWVTFDKKRQRFFISFFTINNFLKIRVISLLLTFCPNNFHEILWSRLCWIHIINMRFNRKVKDITKVFIRNNA